MGTHYSIPVHTFFGGGALILVGIITSLAPLRAHTNILRADDTYRWSDEERIKYQEMTNILANKLAIGKPVQLIESRELVGPAQALGMRWGYGRAAIAIDPYASFIVVDRKCATYDVSSDTLLCPYYLPDAHMEFLLAHELAHIRHNDNLTLSAVPGLVGVIATLSTFRLFPSTAAILTVPRSIFAIVRLFFCGTGIASLVGTTAAVSCICMLSQRLEYVADATAFAVCSDQGKIDAIEFFRSFVEAHIEVRNDPRSSVLARIRYTDKGDDNLDFFHPPLSKRIAALQALLESPTHTSHVDDDPIPDILF